MKKVAAIGIIALLGFIGYNKLKSSYLALKINFRSLGFSAGFPTITLEFVNQNSTTIIIPKGVMQLFYQGKQIAVLELPTEVQVKKGSAFVTVKVVPLFDNFLQTIYSIASNRDISAPLQITGYASVMGVSIDFSINTTITQALNGNF